MFNEDVILKLINLCSLAPSIHNIQPVKFYFEEPDCFYIWADDLIQAPIADPQKRDFYLSLGASIEGFHHACCMLDIQIESQKKIDENTFKFKIAKKTENTILKDDICNKEFSQLIEKRKSYRGIFKKAESVDSISIKNCITITDYEVIKKINTYYIEGTQHFMNKDGFAEELYEWLRFSQNHPRFYYDGLNYENLSLNAFEALFAAAVMNPKIYKLLDQIKLAKHIAGESAQILSSQGLLCIIIPVNSNLIDQGKLFYNVWLELTKQNLYACPMSNVCDDPQSQEKLKILLNLNNEQQVLNILRFGNIPDNYQFKQRARRPLSELIKRPKIGSN